MHVKHVLCAENNIISILNNLDKQPLLTNFSGHV